MKLRRDSAILVVDMQYGFCTEYGIDDAHGISLERIKRIQKEIVPRIREFLDGGRTKGIPIVYPCSTRNVISHQTDILQELYPEIGDLVFWRYGPKESPLTDGYGLESWLPFQEIHHFYVTGVYREYCVARIADELRLAGYELTIVEECCG